MKGYQRNFNCPCGSGEKWKSCHPKLDGKFYDKNHKLIKDRKPQVGLRKSKELEGWEVYKQ